MMVMTVDMIHTAYRAVPDIFVPPKTYDDSNGNILSFVIPMGSCSDPNGNILVCVNPMDSCSHSDGNTLVHVNPMDSRFRLKWEQSWFSEPCGLLFQAIHVVTFTWSNAAWS